MACADRLRSGAKIVLVLALGGAAALTYRSDRLLFELPAVKTQLYADKTSQALARRHGLVFLMTFDEARPTEWIRRGNVLCPGTESGPGRLGRARRFDGRSKTYVSTATEWSKLGATYTLSLWIKLDDIGRDQDIWCTSFQDRFVGFALRDGQLTFFVPGGEPEQIARYPFAAYGRFVHLAGVVDGPGGEARLYENGRLQTRIPIATVDLPKQNMEFGKTRWYSATAPLSAWIDEAAAWTRALSPDEIRRLAQARVSLPFVLEPRRYGRWRLAQAVQAGIPEWLKMLDRFNVLLHEGRLLAADLPDVHLDFSSADARHFSRAHERSLASGRRTAKGANFRRIYAQIDGRTVEAQLCLEGSDVRYAAGKRPGFILEIPAQAPESGSRRWRLIPPENESGEGWARGTQDLCRLSIDGQFKGVYRCEAFDRRGLRPGDKTWVANGPRLPADWRSLFRRPTESCTGVPPAEQEALRNLLVNDIHHPWSRREWDYRMRAVRKAAAPEPAAPTACAVLGDNPSPDYVVGDLALPTNGAWTSSRPDVIAPDGRVTRPDGDRPVAVELAETPPGGGAATALKFRVMPKRRELSALMLWFDEPLSHPRRVEFEAEFHPAGDDGSPRRLRGSQATRGGIKHHGNTSYWEGLKKPLSLRCDEPHRLLDANAATRHLYLLNGFLDATKMRNKLAFDLFRSFGGPGRPRQAPELDWTEVFVNGQYFGIYEMATRIDGETLGENDDDESESPSGAVLYKISSLQNLFMGSGRRAFEQILPPAAQFPCEEPLREFADFVRQADRETFAREIGDRLDLDNAVDFLLLLYFSGNKDGYDGNFYLARDSAPHARFQFVVWDYDHGFGKRNLAMSNLIIDRLRRDAPGFDERLRARWRELRNGPLATAALNARLDEMTARLAGSMDFEFALFSRAGATSFAAETAKWRETVGLLLADMDARFGGPAAGPAPAP